MPLYNKTMIKSIESIDVQGFFDIILLHEGEFIRRAREGGIESMKIEININAACSLCKINMKRVNTIIDRAYENNT